MSSTMSYFDGAGRWRYVISPYKPRRNPIRRGCPASRRADPFKNPLLRLTPPPPPCHGGWPSPARPSRMKFQPRPRFEALAVRGGRIFRSFLGVLEAPRRPWTPRRPLDAPGAPWRPLQGPGALKPRGNPPHAWMKRSNLYRP